MAKLRPSRAWIAYLGTKRNLRGVKRISDMNLKRFKIVGVFDNYREAFEWLMRGRK